MSSLLKILSDTTRNEWINMSYDNLIKNIVEPLNMMGHEARKRIINSLKFAQFDMLTRKLWDAQDVQPTDTDTDANADAEVDVNANNFVEPYERVVPILILLEDILTIRSEIESTKNIQDDIVKQLGLLNLILNPDHFNDIVSKINEDKKRKFIHP
jgi:hypothetical protein